MNNQLVEVEQSNNSNKQINEIIIDALEEKKRALKSKLL